jgi:hypothetical protein
LEEVQKEKQHAKTLEEQLYSPEVQAVLRNTKTRSVVGFSGTPSDLLPISLGSCGYERGSEGKMIHTHKSGVELHCFSVTIFTLGFRLFLFCCK